MSLKKKEGTFFIDQNDPTRHTAGPLDGARRNSPMSQPAGCALARQRGEPTSSELHAAFNALFAETRDVARARALGLGLAPQGRRRP